MRRVPRYATVLPLGDQIGRYSAFLVSVSRRTSPLRRVDREHVVVEDAIGIGLVVRHEQDVAALRRPFDRVLVVVAARQLLDLLARDVDDEDVQAPVVVEAGEPFRRRRLVQIPGDHHRIAVGILGFGPGRRRDERDLLAVRRPGEPLAVGRQRMIRAADRREHDRAGSVGPRHEHAGAGVLAAEVGDLLAVARPARAGGALLVRSEASRRTGRHVHNPDLRVRTARTIAVLDAVGNPRRVGRNLDIADRLQPVQIAALECRAGVRPRRRHGLQRRQRRPRSWFTPERLTRPRTRRHEDRGGRDSNPENLLTHEIPPPDVPRERARCAHRSIAVSLHVYAMSMRARTC